MIPPSKADARSVPLAEGKNDASIERQVVIPDQSSKTFTGRLSFEAISNVFLYFFFIRREKRFLGCFVCNAAYIYLGIFLAGESMNLCS